MKSEERNQITQLYMWIVNIEQVFSLKVERHTQRKSNLEKVVKCCWTVVWFTSLFSPSFGGKLRRLGAENAKMNFQVNR